MIPVPCLSPGICSSLFFPKNKSTGYQRSTTRNLQSSIHSSCELPDPRPLTPDPCPLPYSLFVFFPPMAHLTLQRSLSSICNILLCAFTCPNLFVSKKNIFTIPNAWLRDGTQQGGSQTRPYRHSGIRVPVYSQAYSWTVLSLPPSALPQMSTFRDENIRAGHRPAPTSVGFIHQSSSPCTSVSSAVKNLFSAVKNLFCAVKQPYPPSRPSTAADGSRSGSFTMRNELTNPISPAISGTISATCRAI